MTIIQPVILSGGSGTRLWPASRSMYPKQLLPLVGDRTMLQETALRVTGKPNLAATTLVVCNETHRFLVAEQLLEIGVTASIILEPEGRNTAPAAALAAIAAQQLADPANGSPLLLIMPADHVITNPKAFIAAIEQGESAAENGCLVSFGIQPTSPYTGYGYIEAEPTGGAVMPIRQFVEKPDAETAAKYLASGRYLWNAGIFLFSADAYLTELEQYEPSMVAACRKSMANAAIDSDFCRPDAAAFADSPANSIDYAVMEKTDAAMVVPMDAGWSDVGSWSALHEVSQQDESGNVFSGDVLSHGCTDSFVSSSSRLVATVGLQDMIVVEDKNTVFVAHKDQSHNVQEVVAQLRLQDREESRLHRQVFRPWGSYDSIDADDGFQVKRLIVNPGAVLSLQKHAHRAEHWTVVRGTARITLDDKEFDLGVNESTYIQIGAVHRIANTSEQPVHIIEVQCGDYLGEDDIVRFEDQYGREGTNT